MTAHGRDNSEEYVSVQGLLSTSTNRSKKDKIEKPSYSPLVLYFVENSD
jgi:hypothetical protein